MQKDIQTNLCCVTGDTWIKTTEGPRQISDLIGKRVDLVVNGKIYHKLNGGVFHTGRKQVYELKTKKGYSIKLTEDHKLLKLEELTNEEKSVNFRIEEKQICNMEGTFSVWEEVRNLNPHSKIILSNHRTDIVYKYIPWNGQGTFEEGWLIGFIICKGQIKTDDGNYIEMSSDIGDVEVHMIIIDMVTKCIENGIIQSENLIDKLVSLLHHQQNQKIHVLNIRSNELYILFNKYGFTNNLDITPEIEKTSSNFHIGFLRGMFDVKSIIEPITGRKLNLKDLSMETKLVLYHRYNNVHNLHIVQRMLSRFGIISDVKNYSDNDYKDEYKLSITRDNIKVYSDIINYTRDILKKDLSKGIEMESSKIGEDFVDEIESITPLDYEDVYNVNIDNVYEFCANGIRAHTCDIQIK